LELNDGKNTKVSFRNVDRVVTQGRPSDVFAKDREGDGRLERRATGGGKVGPLDGREKESARNLGQGAKFSEEGTSLKKTPTMRKKGRKVFTSIKRWPFSLK